MTVCKGRPLRSPPIPSVTSLCCTKFVPSRGRGLYGVRRSEQAFESQLSSLAHVMRVSSLTFGVGSVMGRCSLGLICNNLQEFLVFFSNKRVSPFGLRGPQNGSSNKRTGANLRAYGPRYALSVEEPRSEVTRSGLGVW